MGPGLHGVGELDSTRVRMSCAATKIWGSQLNIFLKIYKKIKKLPPTQKRNFIKCDKPKQAAYWTEKVKVKVS